MNDNPNNPANGLDDARIISEFWANRRGEAVRVVLRSYEGSRVVDIRRFFTDKKTGVLRPTRKGITLSIRKLPELAKAIEKAHTAALLAGDIEAPR